MTKEEVVNIALAHGSDLENEVLDYLLEKISKEVYEYEKEDFLKTTMPYEYINSYDSLKRNQAEGKSSGG